MTAILQRIEWEGTMMPVIDYLPCKSNEELGQLNTKLMDAEEFSKVVCILSSSLEEMLILLLKFIT